MNLINLDKTKMSEAEVSLRIAIFLIQRELVNEEVLVSIDGAQIKTGNTVHFDIDGFTSFIGMEKISDTEKWQTTYKYIDKYIKIHSRPGEGDVVAILKNGKKILVESKKGDLIRKPGSKEYPLLREAIGQLMTLENITSNTEVYAAIPKSEKNVELVNRWKEAPLVKKSNIGFILVDREQNLSIIKDFE